MGLAVILTYVILVGLLLLGFAIIQVNKSILKLKQAKEQTQRVVVREMNTEIINVEMCELIRKEDFDRFGERMLEDLKVKFAKEIVDNRVTMDITPDVRHVDFHDMLKVRMRMRIAKN